MSEAKKSQSLEALPTEAAPAVTPPPAPTQKRQLRVMTGRDSQGKTLESLTGYSSTVVNESFNARKPIIVTGTDEGRAMGSESAVLHNLRSIMAVPLQVRNKLLGVVYLDSRLAKGLFTHDDLNILAAIANHIAIAFETAHAATVEAERRALEKDIALAAAVQSLLLPRESDFKSQSLTLSGYYEAASKASGDWWWYKHSEAEDKLTILLGDVTGHGAASAMLTAATAGILQTLLKFGGEKPMDQVLNELNREFLQIAQGKYSMTMSSIEINGSNGSLQFTNAAGPLIFILKADGTVNPIVVSGVPLGSQNFSVGFKEVNITPTDRIFVFTDGLLELALPGGKQLKGKKLASILSKTRGMELHEAKKSILKDISLARQDVPLDDDVTFILIDYKT